MLVQLVSASARSGILDRLQFLIDLICRVAERNFPQRHQIVRSKKRRQFPLCLPRFINISIFEALQEFFRLDVHQLQLFGPIKNRIRNPLLNDNLSNRSHQVVQAFHMLHIDSCKNMNPRVQEFLNIRISFCMSQSPRVCMGKFIHENQLRFSFQRSVQIKLTGCCAFRLKWRQDFHPLKKRHGFRPCMRIDHANYHINARFRDSPRFLQHRVGFSRARRVTEKDFQFSSGFPLHSSFLL